MSIDTFVWLCPLLSVIFFSAIEYKNNKPAHLFTTRFKAILTLIVITYVVNWGLSSYLPAPISNILPYGFLSIPVLKTPNIFSFIVHFLIIDLCYYWLHRLHHMMPMLWRLHRLHHSDKQVDAMTTFLHHPLEAASWFVLLISLYILFDIPFIVILAYALIESLHSGFTHFNILVPEKVDRYLRNIIITPNTHKVHHSLDIKEGNSNFGQVFIFWDYLFNTHQYKPNDETSHLETGVDAKQSPSSPKLMPLLTNPFQ